MFVQQEGLASLPAGNFTVHVQLHVTLTLRLTLFGNKMTCPTANKAPTVDVGGKTSICNYSLLFEKKYIKDLDRNSSSAVISTE